MLLAISVVMPAARAAQLYKWVDENGNVRYSDTLPSDQKKKRFQTLSPHGRVLQTQEASKSPEQLRKEREEKKRKQEEARLKAEEEARIVEQKAHHDNVLLMTYTNEQEILDAQQERLSVIDSVLELLRKNISAERENLKAQHERAKAAYIDKGREIPGGLAQKIEYFTEKLQSKQKQLQTKLLEREKIKQQYNADLQRFRELKNPSAGK